METLTNITKEQQKKNRQDKDLAFAKLKDRKLDTRQKIEWGGLVVKSKMNQYSKEVILGVLMDAKKKIERSPEAKKFFEIKGKAGFSD